MKAGWDGRCVYRLKNTQIAAPTTKTATKYKKGIMEKEIQKVKKGTDRDVITTFLHRKPKEHHHYHHPHSLRDKAARGSEAEKYGCGEKTTAMTITHQEWYSSPTVFIVYSYSNNPSLTFYRYCEATLVPS
jgi:hypothetical protein